MPIKANRRGGVRPGAGRKKGVRDKATGEQRASLEELARTHTEAALAVLAHVMTSGESEAARVSAANSMLDRGYGRPRQAVEVGGDPENPLHHKIESDAAFKNLCEGLDSLVRSAAGGDSSKG